MTAVSLPSDKVESFGGSLIQHGPANERIYLMRLDRGDLPDLPEKLIRFGRERGYGKIFAVVPSDTTPVFAAATYAREAVIPGYFLGQADADILACYLDPARAEHDEKEVDDVLRLARQKSERRTPLDPLPPSHQVRPASPSDIDAMADLYRRVFATYPFPIHDPAYLARTMKEGIVYYGIWQENRLLALSSAETRSYALAVEMTDFATDPDARGAGLARYALARMEKDLAAMGYRTAYTIARAASPGMNICFARGGYAWSGTLWNNTQICGRLEHMNVWHKPLPASDG